MATASELDEFLASVERRAYKQASFAVHNHEQALDLVQDAMLKLVENYSLRPVTELPPLFQRILQNAIRDHYRRHKVRALWTTALSTLTARFSREDEDDEPDPLETLIVADAQQENPHERLTQRQILTAIEAELKRLPPRQREAFLMRYWEELSIAETAQAMRCTEGSVKTHCSRACHALAAALQRKGITL